MPQSGPGSRDPADDPGRRGIVESEAPFVDWLRSATGDPDRPAVPAATVVLLRDAPDGEPAVPEEEGAARGGRVEVLMMHKASKMAFGGMWVFPGGRIDPEDRLPGEAADDLAVACRAACREAQEEAGLVVPEDSLVRYSFWLPPPQAPKRFATWFFLARAPEGRVAIDGGEIQDHRWIRPAEALRLRDAAEVELAPPTWVTLRNLAGYATVAEALDDARRREPERFETHIATTDEGLAALWEGDAGYESFDGAVPGSRHRLVMSGDRWRYERTAP